MRKLFFSLIILLVLGLVVIPASLLFFNEEIKEEPIVKITNIGPEVKVYNVETKKIMNLKLEEYLVGVVAAEMPVAFETEALKAQAIAARTYTVKKLELSKRGQTNPDFKGADLTTSPQNSQAWISAEQMKKNWGVFKFSKNYNKIVKAVNDTNGVVLIHEGKLIDPVYHSTSIGKTENSGDVWKFDVPYLKSVESPGDKESPRFKSELKMTLTELDKKLGTSLHAVSVAKINNATAGTFSVEEKSSTGRIKKIKIGGKVFTGEELRKALGLNSTYFTWKAEKGNITFTVTGFGHGVGMSQYGANYYAKNGKDYKHILAHYYPGTELRKYIK